MRSPEQLRRIPKAELHVHLDGSLRPATLIDLARPAGVSLPSADPEEIRRFMAVRRARDLDEYLSRFALTIAVLQTPESLERVAWEMVEDAWRDGIRYLEVRYCPALSTKDGLPLDDAIAAEWRGLERGAADFGVAVGMINCTLRHLDPDQSADIASASVQGRGRGVVAFDIAGAEAHHAAAPHAAAFELARLGGLATTAHAGEAAGPASIREALDVLGIQRIGHATTLIQDSGLMTEVRSEGITIEACLSSNYQTSAIASLGQHPLAAYLRAGLKVTLCSDNWLMSDVTLSGEYALAQRELGLTDREVDQLVLNGLAGAFAAAPVKERLMEEARDALAAA